MGQVKGTSRMPRRGITALFTPSGGTKAKEKYHGHRRLRRLDMYNEEDHAAEAQTRTQQGHDRPSQGSGFNNV